MTLVLYPITLAAVGLTACVLALLTNRAQFGTLWATLEDLARPNRYTGGHRAGGRATWRHMLVTRARTARSRAARAAYLAMMVVPQPAEPDWMAELSEQYQFGDTDEFDAREVGGAATYDRLPWLADGSSPREFRRRIGAWGTPVEVDEWDLAVTSS